ncbi:MAG: hypothetical protein KUG77_07510 [Nannocystaceae bacterium]|nr:hypothetical protein [Nannocystaceae bacterium]
MRKEGWGLSALVALAACGGSGSNASDPNNTGPGIDPSGATESGESGTTDPDPTGVDDDTTDTDTDDTAVSIALEPPEATIEIVDGEIPPAVDFDALATLADGSTVPVTGTWTFDRPDLGEVVNTGELTASGFSGGLGLLTFAAEGLSAEAQVTIKVHILDDDSVDPAVIPEFDGAVTPDPSLVWSYPYDATVFPKGLRGPTLQWGGGADTDIYYVHADSPTFEYEFWGQVVNPSRFDLPDLGQDVWQLLTDSVTGQLDVSIQRFDGTQAFVPIARTWTIADAVLTGSVYYWEVNNGSVVRLETGADAPETFLQLPEGVECVACHSVSKDGSTIVASFHGGYSPWGTFDTQDGTSILATDTASGFQAISPTGSHVLWGQYGNGTDFNLTLSLSDDPTPLALSLIHI